jgi:four helix bundle protein
MTLIKRFEEMQAWQEARRLTQQIYQLSEQEGFAHDSVLRNQIRQAALAALTDIAAGFDCDSSKEFARFLGDARRSVVEVQSLLYVALDAGYLTQDNLQAHYDQAEKTKLLIGGLKRSLEKRN